MAIWGSTGTPLSDPTDENAWRRLLHRATDARNRHPGKSHQCRLNCGEMDESMLHMITCPNQAHQTFWNEVKRFCTRVLADRSAWDYPKTIIFGIDVQDNLLGESTRAFIRHAIRWWYAAMRAIDVQGGTFVHELIMVRTLQSYKESVVRYAVSIRKHFIHRQHTKLQGVVSEETRARFSTLVSIGMEGHYQLTPGFTNAIDRAQTALDRYRQQQQP